MEEAESLLGRFLSHYRIVEKIGAGGMGDVYRAHDELLDRDVAVKVLPSGVLADEAVRKQFRNEALLLAKLNHPYIETVHEFGRQNDADFLVIELIHGQPLSWSLRTGCLPEKEVLRLGTQLLEGLAAAHKQGVIHRDLKPANIFVTPDGRIKILDFGLAKLIHHETAVDTTVSITANSGTIAGTVPYMAPEQLRGEPADVRSDIYGAGAVLYEMATARRAFPQTQGPQLMGAILHEPPMLPSTLNPQVSAGLESGIMKALEKAPWQRYQSANELKAVLESLMSAQLPRTAPNMKVGARTENLLGRPASGTDPFRFKILAGIGIAGILLVGLLIGLNVSGWRDRLFPRMTSGNESELAVPGTIKARPSVAVLGFKNVSERPEEAWLSTALSEMLTTELAVGEQLRTIPGENVARMKIDLSLPDADSYGKDTLAKIRRNLGTDEVVLGSYVPLEKGHLRLDLRLQNTAAGQTLAVVSEKGTEEQLDDLVSRAGLAVRDKLGAGDISNAEAAAVKAALPSNAEAARLYAEGLTQMRVFNNVAARDLLEKAVAVEPSYTLAHSGLAAAWSNLGYEEKAAAEAKRASELSSSLSRQDHLSVEGLYRETTHEWEKAVEIYKTLFGFFPDNVEYGISLARAQIRAGNGKGGLATVDALKQSLSSQRDDPRIDLTEATAAQAVSDYEHELKAATRAADKAQEAESKLLLARARLAQGVALLNLGKPKEALAACGDARKIYTAAGDRSGVAAALNGAANVSANQGDDPGSKRMYEGALAIYREIGNKKGAAAALDNIATAVSDTGDLAGARKLSEEALALFREVGDKDDIAATLSNLATYSAEEGDLAGATKLTRQSLEIRREIGNKGGQASALNNLADGLMKQGDVAASKIAYEESLRLHEEAGQKSATTFPLCGLGELLLNSGDLMGALQRFEKSEAIAHETDEKPLLPAALSGMGEVFLQQGHFSDARRVYEQALAIDKDLDYKAEAAEMLLGLAQVKLAEGHPAGAQSSIAEALKEFRAGKLRDDEIVGHTVLAQALVAEGKTNRAREEIDLAKGLAVKTQNRIVGLELAIAEARVLFAGDKFAEATSILAAAQAEAEKLGLVRYDLEARLMIAELEITSGNVVVGREHLAALEKEASAKGFMLLARNANTL
jgi:eukaryotic-like serine/threonine-protein kinase